MTQATTTRSAARTQFLLDAFTAAIENDGYGQFACHEYKHTGDDPHAVIEFDDDETQHHIDLDTMARGVGVIRAARPAVDAKYPDDGEVLHNAATGVRLFLSTAARANILLADRTNGYDGDIDVVAALAVLECAVFGAVTYC